MKSTPINLLLLLVLFASNAKAQQESQSNSFSLQQAIDYALKNSPSAITANNDVIAAKYKKREIAGIGLPQISATFDFKDFFKIPVSVIPNFVAPAVYSGIVAATTPTGQAPQYDQSKLDAANYPAIAAQFGTKYQTSASASLSQIIFSSDYIVALQAADYLQKLSTISATRTKADVVSSVSKAYYSVLVNTARLQVLTSNIERLSNSLENLKALNKEGFAELIDVERLEVSYNNLLTEKVNVERQMNLSEALLRFQMGYVGENNLQLTDKLPDDISESEITVTKSDAASRPEFQMAQASYELNVINLKKEKLGYLPTIAGYASGGYNSFSADKVDFYKNTSNWYPNFVVGARLDVKLFDGLQRQNRIQQVKLDIIKSQQNMNMLTNAINVEINSSAVAVNNALSSLKAQTRNRELAKHVQEVTELKFKQGIGSNLEVLNAESSLRESDANYFTAIYNFLVAKTDYLKATGTLIK